MRFFARWWGSEPQSTCGAAKKAVCIHACTSTIGRAQQLLQGTHKRKEGSCCILGYSGWTPEAIQEAAQSLNAVVCDIRYAPASRHPQWRKHQLSQLLGARYQHVQALGNRNYKSGGPVALTDYDTGKQVIAEILATGQSVILMCACKDVAMCHRLTAAERLTADLSKAVTHLFPQKKKRAQETQANLF